MSPEMKESDSTIDMNVVLLPDAKTRDYLIELSSYLARRVNGHFTLSNSFHLPHLSLFPNQYPAKNKAGLTNSLRELAEDCDEFSVTLHGYSQISGFAFIDAVASDKLFQLHAKAVKAFNPLREGHAPALVSDLKNLTPDQQSKVEEYGNPIVLDTWVPHVTLTHTENIEKLEETFAEMPDMELSFTADSLHLSEFAQYGTCPRVYSSFPTKK